MVVTGCIATATETDPSCMPATPIYYMVPKWKKSKNRYDRSTGNSQGNTWSESASHMASRSVEQYNLQRMLVVLITVGQSTTVLKQMQ